MSAVDPNWLCLAVLDVGVLLVLSSRLVLHTKRRVRCQVLGGRGFPWLKCVLACFRCFCLHSVHRTPAGPSEKAIHLKRAANFSARHRGQQRCVSLFVSSLFLVSSQPFPEAPFLDGQLLHGACVGRFIARACVRPHAALLITGMLRLLIHLCHDSVCVCVCVR